MKEFDGIGEFAESTTREGREVIGLTGRVTKVPTCDTLFLDKDGNPKIRLNTSYRPTRPITFVGDVLRTALRSGVPASIETDLDDLLMYLCDIFDSNAHNASQHDLGEAPSKKGARDIYITTDVVLNDIPAVASMTTSFLKQDFANGGEIFGREFYDILLRSAREDRETRIDQDTTRTVQKSRNRLIAWDVTNAYSIREEIYRQNPEVTAENMFNILSQSAGADTRVLDKLLDDMVFARLGILEKPRTGTEPIRYVDPVTSTTIIVRASEDETFEVELAYEMPDEITQIHFQNTRGTMRITSEESGADSSDRVTLRTQKAQMSYDELRRFIFDARSHHNSPKRSPIRHSRRSGVADINGLSFGDLQVNIPSNKTHMAVTIANFEGNLEIIDTSANIAIAHSTVTDLAIQYSTANQIIVRDTTITSVDILEAKIRLESIVVDILNLNRSHVDGIRVNAGDTIIAVDCTGDIKLAEGTSPQVQITRLNITEAELITIT